MLKRLILQELFLMACAREGTSFRAHKCCVGNISLPPETTADFESHLLGVNGAQD